MRSPRRLPQRVEPRPVRPQQAPLLSLSLAGGSGASQRTHAEPVSHPSADGSRRDPPVSFPPALVPGFTPRCRPPRLPRVRAGCTLAGRARRSSRSAPPPQRPRSPCLKTAAVATRDAVLGRRAVRRTVLPVPLIEHCARRPLHSIRRAGPCVSRI